MHTIEEIYKAVCDETKISGSRSDKRLKIAHDFIAQDILEVSRSCEIKHLSLSNNNEITVPYGNHGENKKVDFAVLKNNILILTGGTKFIMSSYNKNSINYCESEYSQASLLSKNTPYFSINVIPLEIPIKDKNGEIVSFETPTKRNLYYDIDDLENVYLGVYYIDKDFNIQYSIGYSYENLILKIGTLIG